MKILFFSDMHFRLYGSILSFNVVGENGVTEELNRAIKSMRWLMKVVCECEPDLVICLGDIYHTLFTVDSPVVVISTRCFRELYDLCKKINSKLWIIPGNHDYYKKGIYTCSEIPSDRVFVNPTVYKERDISFGIVPYTDPEPEMQLTIERFIKDSDYILTHATFVGAKFGSRRIAGDGISPAGNKRIFSGHVHLFQELKNVLYIGSLYQINTSEWESPHGVVLYDTDNNKYQFIENTVVKGIIPINDKNYYIIYDLDPNRFYIKASLSDGVYSEVKDILCEFEHSCFKVNNKREAEKSEIDLSYIETPEYVISQILENNYKDLYDLWRKIGEI